MFLKAFYMAFLYCIIFVNFLLDYGGGGSPADDVKQAIDVLSLLSGQEGGIKPRVLTHRGKYSDEGSSDVRSESSHERAERYIQALSVIIGSDILRNLRKISSKAIIGFPYCDILRLLPN